MLLDHQAKLDRSRKIGFTEPLSINVTQATRTPLQPVNQS